MYSDNTDENCRDRWAEAHMTTQADLRAAFVIALLAALLATTCAYARGVADGRQACEVQHGQD